MSKAGSILGIIGGLMMVIGGIYFLNIILSSIEGRSIPYEMLPFSNASILNCILTAVWGFLAIIGALAGIKGKVGNYLLLIAGGLAVAGFFINSYPGEGYYPSVPLSSSFFYFYFSANDVHNILLSLIDPLLILTGGIIGVAVKTEKAQMDSYGMTKSMKKARKKYGKY